MKKASNLCESFGSVMTAGQTFDERIGTLKPFADCINEHLELGLIQAWDVKGFFAIDPAMKKALGDPDDPYYSAFARAVIELVDYVHPDDYVSLICDDDEKTAWSCYQHYRAIRQANEDIRKKTVSLSFANDALYPALQAADLAAYLSRREARLMFYGEEYGFKPLFDYLTRKQPLGKMDWRTMFAREEHLTSMALGKS